MESFHVGLVNHCFGYCYAAYFSFFSFILLGIMKIYFHIEDTTLELVIFAIPIVIGYIPMYRSVFMNDRYLCFYKEFEKKDVQWHKNGKGLLCFFCIGGFLSMVIGAFTLLNLLANNYDANIG